MNLRLFAAAMSAAFLVPLNDLWADTGAPKPMYNVKFSATSPLLDGEIDSDPAWKNVPWSSGFVTLKKNEAPVGASRFKALSATEGLWFAFECSEPEMARIHDEKKGMFWEHDVVELFLLAKRPGEEDEKTHFLLSARGAKNDETPASVLERTGFMNGWGGASKLCGDKWTAEIFVPYYLIGMIPEKETSVPANLCRHASPRRELSSWAFQESGFGNTAGFGVLSLAPAPKEALPSMMKNLRSPHFVSVPPRFAELRRDWDLLRSEEGRGLVSKLDKSLVFAKSPEEQTAALADFKRLEELWRELRQKSRASAEKLVFGGP